MSDQVPSVSPLPDNTRPLIEQIRGRPWLSVFTAALILLLALDLCGRVKVDGWAIVLFLLAILPWTLSAMIEALTTLGDAFVKSSLKSVQIGNFKIEQLEKKVTEQAEQIDIQRKILDDLALYSMAFYIYDKLKYLCLGTLPESAGRYGEYKYHPDEAFDHDLRYLRDHGYLELFQIAQLQPGENLVGKLVPTEMGRRFVELKEARLARLDGDARTPAVPVVTVPDQ